MTTLHTPLFVPTPDTREAQDARWSTWQMNGAVQALHSHRRVQIAFVVLGVLVSLTFLISR